ncbi:MAG: hypothetical protein LUE90_05415 [Clostridiales bacterium]|nr:hypothetical protein [Clostridiales bacterium]
MKRKTRKMKWIALLMAAALVLTTTQSGLVAALAEDVSSEADTGADENSGTEDEEAAEEQSGDSGEDTGSGEESNVSVAAEEATAETVAELTAVENVQALVAALPSVEDLDEKTTSELNDIYTQLNEAYDAYCELSEEEQAEVGDEEELFGGLFDYFNSLTVTASEGNEISAAADDYVAYVGDTGCSTIADAVSAVNSATSAVTLKLNSNLSLTTSIVISNSSATVTLDLNGYSITRGDGNTTSYLIEVASGASLIVKDSSSNGNITSLNYTVSSTTYGGYGILTYGTLTIESGTVSGYCGVYVSGDTASLTVSGGTVSGTNRALNVSAGTVNVSAGSVQGGSYGIIAGSNAAVNVSGGEVSASTIAIQVGTSSSTATATISGGTVTASTYYAIYNYGTTSITDGTITATASGNGQAFAVVNYGTLSVTGGTVAGNDLGIFSNGTSANVTIGTENAASNDIPVISGGESSEAIYMTNGATTTVNSGTIIDNNSEGSGIVVYGNGTDTTTLIVNGGAISGQDFGISTNGSSSAGLCDITINGGTITGGATGMYLPAVESTTTINGGTITGSNSTYGTGIEIRASVLNVTGGTIIGNGNPAEYDFNGNGTTVNAVGIAVSQHTTNQTITVNISGGNISGYYGVFETNTNSSNSSAVTVNISGGTVSSTVSDGAAVYSTSLDSDYTGTKSDDVTTTFSISGGYFSTVVDSDYLASDDYHADTVASYDADGNSGSTYYSVHKHDTTYMTYVAATAATCAATGNTAYYYCPYCDSYYTDANGANATTLEAVTIAIDSSNHSESWSNPVWSWSSDYSTATATFTCEYLASHTETVNATITSTESDSQIVYTATVTRSDGTEFTDTHIELKTVEAEVVIVSTEADVSGVSEENQETAKSVADTIEVADESQVEALVTAISEENAETYKDVAASALKDAGVTLTDSTVITITTEVYLTKTVKEIVTTEGSKSITVDITLNSVVKATTNYGDETVLQEETAIQLAQGQAIDIEIDITDMGFENEDILYVGHDSSYGYYYYKPTFSTVSGRRIATFTNLHGFSDFTVSEDSRTATVNYTDGDIGTVTYTPENVGLSLPVLSKDGCTFNGWTFDGIDGTYTTLTDDLLTLLSALYAENGGTAITATAVFTSNATTTSTSTTTAVKTGDTNSMGLYLALIVVCAAGLTATMAVRRKNAHSMKRET